MKGKVKAEVYEQEMVHLSKVLLGFLLGVGSILSVWILAGVSFVLLK